MADEDDDLAYQLGRRYREACEHISHRNAPHSTQYPKYIRSFAECCLFKIEQ